MCRRKFLACLAALTVLLSCAVPGVSAAEATGGWYEVLEETYVSGSDNFIAINGTETTVKVDIEPYRMLAKIDMLICYGSYLPTSVSVRYNGNYTQLNVVNLGNCICRVYGNIPYGKYEDIYIRFVKNGTAQCTYEVLSLKVSSLLVTDFQAQGKLYRSYSDPSPLTLPNNFSVAAVDSDYQYEYKLIPVRITDWQKYDTVTLFGSISTMALNSFRASIGNKGLPYTITYMESIPTSTESGGGFSYDYVSSTETNYYDAPGTPDEFSTEDGFAAGESWNTSTVVYGGSVLFTITIDLTGVDRTLSGNLECFFTCICSPWLGYSFNVQNCTGSVITADTSTVNWWTKFTTFMQNLFSPDTSDSDQFQGEAQEKVDQMEEANQALDNVTKPAIEDIEVDFSEFATDADFTAVGNVFGYMVNDDFFAMILLMSLTVALLGYVLYGKR